MRRERTVARLAVQVALACVVLGAGCRDDADEVPRYGELPDFQLVDQDGRVFQRSDMLGHVTIASFVFTTCSTICPLLSDRTRQLQARFADRAGAIRLLSISVDPEHDTPAVLRAHGRRYGADHSLWTLLTGPTEEVSRVAVRGFRVAMGRPEPTAAGAYDIMHSSHLVLVDSSATIRGYYGVEPEEMARLVRDAEQLAD